jgi:ADP-ribose pyrophosphatase YjhB (NUDIX family)
MSERPQFRLHASVLIADSSGRVLIVQEAKPQTRERWNLPGGHVEQGEGIVVGAAREMREETGLDVPLTALLGIYTSEAAVRFVFLAALGNEPFRAGDEILDVRLIQPDDLLAMPDGELVSPAMFRQIVDDLVNGKRYPIGMIQGPAFRPSV